MRTGGLRNIALKWLSWQIRSVGQLFVTAASTPWMVRFFGRKSVAVAISISNSADRCEPPVPTRVAPPPEWDPRLWERTGGRTASEAHD